MQLIRNYDFGFTIHTLQNNKGRLMLVRRII